MTAIKCLSVDQPDAQLIFTFGADGKPVKPMEIRSWATQYRGPLAIASTQALPKYYRIGDYLAKPFEVPGPRRWGLWQKSDERQSMAVATLWRGAIIGTVRLVDCVPITDQFHGFPKVRKDPGWWIIAPAGSDHLYGASYNGAGITTIPLQQFMGQRPYGDFTPGNYAWILEDAKPVQERCPRCRGEGYIAGHIGRVPCNICNGKGTCQPIPVKGRQGIYEVEL